MSNQSYTANEIFEYCANKIVINGISIVRDINGNLLELSPKDSTVSRLLLHDGVWEQDINYLLSKLVKKGDVAINMGTHIGFHTLHISNLVGETGQVYAFEANPYTYQFLINNLFLNNISNVHPYNKAVYSENSVVQFQTQNDVEENLGAARVISSSEFDSDARKLINIEAIKIDDVLSHVPKINFILMDIEGSESRAISGAMELISRSEDLIIIQEWSPNNIKKHSNLVEYIEFWQSLGYEIASIPRVYQDFVLVKKTSQELESFDGDVLISKNVSAINEKIEHEQFYRYSYCPEGYLNDYKVNHYIVDPLFYRAENIIEFLASRNLDFEVNGKAIALLYLVYMDYLHAVKQLIESGINIEVKNQKGLTPLCIAVAKDYLKMTKLLLEYNSDIECDIPSIGRPLHMATISSNQEMIELLVDAGANIEAIASNGLTPLCIAAQVKQTVIVKALIEHHANIECKFPSGANALYVSSYLGDTATAILLMKAGADKKVIVDGMDIVTIARSNNYPETAKLFEVGVEDFCGQTSDEKLIEICGQDLNYKTILEN